MRILSCLGSLALGAAIMASAGTAAAEDAPKEYSTCTRKPTSAETSAAKGAFQAGQAAFNEADYGRAITYWEDAFHRDCTANPLLLNLARAYELDGQKRHAALALQTFVDRSPGSSDEAQIKRRIDKLNEQIAAETASQATQTATTTPAAGPTTPETTATQTGTSAPAATAAPSPDTGKPHRSAVPLIVAGAGGALAIVGGVVFFSAQSTISDVESQCPNRQCPPGKAGLIDSGNSARTRATIGGTVALVGLAAGIGGVVWYFAQPSPQKQAQGVAPRGFSAGLRTNAGPGFAGMSLVGQF